MIGLPEHHFFQVDLQTLGLLKVSGSGATALLQGQLSCDITEVNPKQSRLGTHCNPSGRALATFRLFVYQQDYYLLMPKSMISFLLIDLEKYAVFYSLNLQDVSEQYRILGLGGVSAEIELAAWYPGLVWTADAVFLMARSIVVLSIPGPIPRFVMLSASSSSVLEGNAPMLLESVWQLLDIQGGIATLYPETRALLTPHHLNYHQLKGVSFKKGCYTGQEVIARMQYLGSLKTQLCPVLLKGTLPLPGDLIEDEKGKKQGTILMAAKTPSSSQKEGCLAGGYLALVSLQKSAVDQPLFFKGTSARVCA